MTLGTVMDEIQKSRTQKTTNSRNTKFRQSLLGTFLGQCHWQGKASVISRFPFFLLSLGVLSFILLVFLFGKCLSNLMKFSRVIGGYSDIYRQKTIISFLPFYETKLLILQMVFLSLLRSSIHLISEHPTKSSFLVGPAVRLLLDHYAIKTSGLKASGPKKNILKGDVLSHISDKKLAPVKQLVASPLQKIRLNNEVVSEVSHPILPQKLFGRHEFTQRNDHVDIQLSELRQSTTKRIVESKNSIPHAYASAYISVNKIMHLLNWLSERTEFKLSIDDFVIKACSLALRYVPELNAHFHDINSIRCIPSVDISIMVATPKGMVTSVLANADQLTLLQISERLHELSTAQTSECQLYSEGSKDGTFTICNLGMFDSVSDFTAVINPPQAAILTIGGLRRHFEPNKIVGKPKLVSEICVTLCYDARTIEEHTARQFLDIFRNSLTSPEALIASEALFGELAEMELHEKNAGICETEHKSISEKEEGLAKLLI